MQCVSTSPQHILSSITVKITFWLSSCWLHWVVSSSEWTCKKKNLIPSMVVAITIQHPTRKSFKSKVVIVASEISLIALCSMFSDVHSLLIYSFPTKYPAEELEILKSILSFPSLYCRWYRLAIFFIFFLFLYTLARFIKENC